MPDFITHDKRTISESEFQEALNKVADDWERLGEAIYKENAYADHVSESLKLSNRDQHYARAAEIRAGQVNSFTIWQRVTELLTGECVALLS